MDTALFGGLQQSLSTEISASIVLQKIDAPPSTCTRAMMPSHSHTIAVSARPRCCHVQCRAGALLQGWCWEESGASVEDGVECG